MCRQLMLEPQRIKLDDINTLQNNLRNEIGKAQASGKNLNEHFGKLK